MSIAVSGRVDSSLINDDLAPTTSAHRTWGTYNYIALWFSMSMEITTYQLASSLIAKGMDWKQAVATVLLGNLIVLVPMLLNAHAGAKYGIPFPVFIRAPFGVRGANIPAVLRALVACGWFGIQSWIGGQAIHSMLLVMWPTIAHVEWALWACFLGFWLLNMAVVWRGVESIRFLQGFGAPFMFIMAAALLVWVRMKAGSFGAMLETPSKFHSWHEFLPVFFSYVDRHGRLLGNARVEYPGLHALLQIAGRANRRPGIWAARCDDALYVCGHRLYFSVGRAIWRAYLES